ncbi:hypothetical protein Tco_1557718, partial [Tanacetum coccineum]
GLYSTHSPVSRTAQVSATLYEDLLPFCPLSVHTVLKAEEEGWATGTTSPLSNTSIQKQVSFLILELEECLEFFVWLPGVGYAPSYRLDTGYIDQVDF